MATREPPVELYYDPADLDPEAPRLYVWRDGDTWALEDEEGTVLSSHLTQRDAIEEAHDRSAVRFCEILARGSTGRIEWRIDQNPAMRKATEYWRTKARQQREAAD